MKAIEKIVGNSSVSRSSPTSLELWDLDDLKEAALCGRLDPRSAAENEVNHIALHVLSAERGRGDVEGHLVSAFQRVEKMANPDRGVWKYYLYLLAKELCGGQLPDYIRQNAGTFEVDFQKCSTFLRHAFSARFGPKFSSICAARNWKFAD